MTIVTSDTQAEAVCIICDSLVILLRDPDAQSFISQVSDLREDKNMTAGARLAKLFEMLDQYRQARPQRSAAGRLH